VGSNISSVTPGAESSRKQHTYEQRMCEYDRSLCGGKDSSRATRVLPEIDSEIGTLGTTRCSTVQSLTCFFAGYGALGVFRWLAIHPFKAEDIVLPVIVPEKKEVYCMTKEIKGRREAMIVSTTVTGDRPLLSPHVKL